MAGWKSHRDTTVSSSLLRCRRWMFLVDAMRSSRLFSQAVRESLVPEYQLLCVGILIHEQGQTCELPHSVSNLPRPAIMSPKPL